MISQDDIERTLALKCAYYQNNFSYKYIRLLAMLYITVLLAATIVAYKVVVIGPIVEPGSTLIYTSSFFLMNIFSEVYGPYLSRKLIWETITCGYLFAFLLTAINFLPSPNYWDNSEIYNQILGSILRFTNAGVIGYLLSTFLNVYLLTKWKYKMAGRLFWLRSLLASTVSEGMATFIAGLLAFFGMMSTANIFLIMTNAFIFKILYGFIAVIPASFFAFLLKKLEAKENVFATHSPHLTV